MLDPAIALTRDLVAIPSVNPSLVPGAAGEAGVADLVAARLRSAGLDVEVREVLPGRPNVVGVIEARERCGGKSSASNHARISSRALPPRPN